MFKEVGDFVGKYLKNSDVNEIEKQESLADRLFDLDLSEKNVAFIVEHGQDFVDYPGALAKRLSMKVSVAKDALDVLQAFKIKQISIEEIKRFELLVKENPLESPQQIALSYGIHRDIVSAYLAYSETNSLTELDKITIKEKYNDGFSITEIGNQFALSEKKIREYVENTFIFFYGKEGAKIFEILNKNFEEYPMMKLREMIITTNVKLQEKICCELPKRNERDYRDVKQYFLKFEESQNFFEIEETLSIEAKTRIRASSLDDIGELSIKLNRIERVIRNYLLQYYPDINLLIYLTQERLKQIQKIEANFGGDTQIPHTTYRMIISDSIDSLIKNAKSMEEKSLSKIFKELLPLAFYYIKCSLPLEELTRIIVSITNMSLTTLDIFHLIFQMSDSVVRGLCLEHYSFSNPVPFYYPILESHHREETSIRFEICKELWYSLQQFTGLVSFGLGWASWNPIGKSHLLDLVFETDFVKRSPQKSPFHLSSIDIQMTKNLFGRIKKTSNESTKWAYVDCHGCSDMKIIKDICQNLDIALIHVSYSDYVENFSRMEEDLNTITLNTKHVYVFVRDCAGAELTTKQVPISDRTSETYTFIFIPNLIEQDVKLLLALKKIGYMILHPTIASPRSVGSNFLENLITRYGSWDNLEREKVLVDNIKSHIHTNTQITATSNIEFSFLSYYPHFVEYMCCYYDALNETDQKIIDKLNEKCEQLSNHLENTEMNAIVWHFNDILAEENSTLILWKLSQEFKILSQRLVGVNKKTSYTLELLWREALLSSKYNETISDDKPGGNYPEMFSANFSNHVERGEPFELIDGDNLRFFNQDINVLLSNFYGNQFYEKSGTDGNKRPPIVVSIFGPQSSGKSTLLNYCFGCKFLTSAGRCTKGVYASLSKLSQPVNNSDHFLILDTEGLDAIEKGRAFQDSSCISFDRTMVLFCLAVSQVAIINVKGDLGEEMRNLLQMYVLTLFTN